MMHSVTRTEGLAECRVSGLYGELRQTVRTARVAASFTGSARAQASAPEPQRHGEKNHIFVPTESLQPLPTTAISTTDPSKNHVHLGVTVKERQYIHLESPRQEKTH